MKLAYQPFVNLCKKRLPAFSLVEMSIVLVIMGILMAAVFKGSDLLDLAKLQSISSDFQQFKVAIQTYKDTYQALPGDDANASQRFGNGVGSGNGNSIIDSDEQALVWQHLYKAGDFPQEKAPTSKMGGFYSVVYGPDASLPGHWIKLAGINDAGVLTPKQAQKLMARIDGQAAGDTPSAGTLRVMNGSNAGANACVIDGHLNLSMTQPTCIVFMQLD